MGPSLSSTFLYMVGGWRIPPITPEDIAFVQEAGVKAVLVGESLIKQSNHGKAISQLFGRDISEEQVPLQKMSIFLSS